MEAIHKDNYKALGEVLPKTLWAQNLMLRGARNSVLNILQKSGAHTVLDVCSGAGVLAHMIQQRGIQVEAVDGSPTGLLGWLKRRNSRFYQVRHQLFGNLTVAAVVN